MSKAKKRFIDANALKKAIDHTGVDMLESADYFGFTYKKIMRVIDDAPTAHVAPVVPGWWEKIDSSYYRWTPSGGTFVDRATYRCSHCGRGTAVKSNYCPNCGCRMEGAEDSNNQKGKQE